MPGWKSFDPPLSDKENEAGKTTYLLKTNFQYWREYRTQFHIALDFGVSEATVCRTIAKVENILVRSGQFRLSSKRQLLDPDDRTDVALVDVTEGVVERPQKNSGPSTAARNDNTP